MTAPAAQSDGDTAASARRTRNKPSKPLLDRVRTSIEEVGDCWEWQGAYNGLTTPVTRYRLGDDGKWRTVSVRRALLHDQGTRIPANMLPVMSCGNHRCVNPGHIVLRPVKQVMKKRAQKFTTGARGVMWAAKIAATTRRTIARLTWDDVQAIRASDDSLQVEAERYGVRVNHIRNIRAGKVWREYHHNPWFGLFRS